MNAIELCRRGDALIHIGNDIREYSTRFAENQGRLRASMVEVAKLLRHSAKGIKQMAESMRYDDPPGVRYALDVHKLLLEDMADELERPGKTKYAPTLERTQAAVILGETKEDK